MQGASGQPLAPVLHVGGLVTARGKRSGSDQVAELSRPALSSYLSQGSSSVTKSELISEVAGQMRDLSHKQVELLVNTVFCSMRDALADGDRIEIRGFGSFQVRERAARRGRNPRTGEEVLVQATRIPFFRVGKELRERVNGQ